MDIQYPAQVDRHEDGSYFVRFLDLEDTFTEGGTLDEALINASEVLSAMLAWRVAAGWELPAPSAKVEGACLVAPHLTPAPTAPSSPAPGSARRRTRCRRPSAGRGPGG